MSEWNVTASPEAAAGAATYSKLLLAVYDVAVLDLELPLVWGCPARRLLQLYDANVSGRHLDVGVGTGYFLDRCTFPVADPVVHLMDLNPNSLDRTAARIARYCPVAHRWNVLEPVPPGLPRFDSIAATNLLHCLPGTMANKGVVFANLKPLLGDGGVLFGATLLGKGVPAGPVRRSLLRTYNRRAIFTNLEDGAADLEASLREHFPTWSLEVVGAMALFTGRKGPAAGGGR